MCAVKFEKCRIGLSQFIWQTNRRALKRDEILLQ